MYCIALATIVSLQLEHGWYYLACKKCNKKVTENNEKIFHNDGEKSATTFFCKKCNKSIVAEDFKVRIRVIDESGTASFVMFDREVMSIAHKSAYDLKDSLSRVDDIDSCQEELNNLVGKKFLFKVEISNYNLKQKWEVYAINKMSDNDDLMQSFLSTSTITKDDASNSISINYDGHKAIVDVEKESISCVEDNDQLLGSSPSISIKQSIEVDSCDFEAELSTTKKKKTEVKIEKDEN
ncbi:uncharacterized protein LOC110713498 [Chenopodium quinoa]|uniref:uncharacterized protein LOC110713498 n=1 Tax=Chenopodium quinoa TaxID=63459 RepID=UPI000B77322A|nr:uncharacterized protein LOC110713498 [Chenopodium quinoa]